MTPRRSAAIAWILCIPLAVGAAGNPAPARVRLQLKWYHQFQFAGYYAAAEKGFYREEGLEVEFLEGKPGLDFTEVVLSGAAQFGINNADLMIDRAQGRAVVVLGAVFQHSPSSCWAARRRAGLSADLVGKRVMVSRTGKREIYSMFLNEGIALESVRFVPHSWDVEDLLQGAVDARPAPIRPTS
jgi:ABC-type nitrate/sulfonate/bicarbonate transport system substrate-binding protein